MSNLDKEIAEALAKVERLKQKKREAEAKERARFGEAVLAVLDEIDDVDAVSVRTLVDRAHARINDRLAKRKRAAAKAAASRREAASDVTNESVAHPDWGEQR